MNNKNMSAPNSAVLDLRRYASDSSVPTSDILREAYILSSKLELTDFHQWCDCEMNGYLDKDVDLPAYRTRIRVTLRAFNPYHGWTPVQIPESWDIDLSYFPCIQSIKEIESLLSSSDEIHITPSSDMQDVLRTLFKVNYEFRFFPNRTSLAGLINTARNKIIDWTLRLEKEGIMGYDIQLTRKEVTETTSVVSHQNINIDKFQGILGDQNSHICQNLTMENHAGDFDKLVDELRKHQVTFDDITDLKRAINSDGDINLNTKDYGNNVKKWFSNMVGKAADGSWQISVATVGNVLGAALNGYYGIGS